MDVSELTWLPGWVLWALFGMLLLFPGPGYKVYMSPWMSRWLLENMEAGACQWVIVTESGLDWARRKMKGRGTPCPEVGMPSPSKSLDRGSQVLTGTASGPHSDLGAYNTTSLHEIKILTPLPFSI